MFLTFRIEMNRHKYNCFQRKKNRKILSIGDHELDLILKKYSTERTVFMQIGLSDIKEAIKSDPYKFIIQKFIHFDNILTPGFTPSFRSSGIYHKQFSLPEYGMFSKLFLKDACYRTNDAIHSILVKGDYNFDECNHSDSFGKESCFAKLDQDNVLYCNIGTDWLICSQLHHIERILKVPYLEVIKYPGIIYYDEKNYEHIEQTNYRYNLNVRWNRIKIQKHLFNAGILDVYNLNGLSLMFIKSKELRDFITKKITAAPYYLVT